MKDYKARIKMLQMPLADWLELNPILLYGEWGVVSDVEDMKIGDGVNKFDSLPFLFGSKGLNNLPRNFQRIETWNGGDTETTGYQKLFTLPAGKWVFLPNQNFIYEDVRVIDYESSLKDIVLGEYTDSQTNTEYTFGERSLIKFSNQENNTPLNLCVIVQNTEPLDVYSHFTGTDYQSEFSYFYHVIAYPIK